MRYPSPCQRSTASPTRERHASTVCATVVDTADRNDENSSGSAATGRVGRGASGSGRGSGAAGSSSVSSARAASGDSDPPPTAWYAISRFTMPISSRTFDAPTSATVSSTPAGIATPRSVHLATQDGQPRLEVGRRDVHQQPARQPRHQPLVQVGDLARRPVAGQHDLPLHRLQRLGEPQQLGLHLEVLGQELHVVEQQQVRLLRAAAERVDLARRHRGVVALDELLERQVLHPQAWLCRSSARKPIAWSRCVLPSPDFP